jgi:hypothetical protein
VSWTEEPGEFRWILRGRGETVDVTILWFDEMWGHEEDEKGRQLFHRSCSIRSFCDAVADGAQRVLDQYGTAGYREEWAAHDFPVDALAALRSAL